MKLFISYARRDSELVDELAAVLGGGGHEVWHDARIVGGQRWWDEILDRIQTSDVLAFCISPGSLRSPACQSEVAWAMALGRPVIPVVVRPTNLDLLPRPIDAMNVVDFQHPTPLAVAQLMRAVASAPPAAPPPDRPPVAPPPPVSDLSPVRDLLERPLLDFTEQMSILEELKAQVGNVDQLATLVDLLRVFRQRSDILQRVAQEVDHLIRIAPVEPGDDHAPPPRRTMADRDEGVPDILRSLVTHLRDGHFTPILGFGLSESFLGTRRWLAHQWATTFEFPMSKHHQDDLPSVAQFVAAMTNHDTLLSSMRDFMAGRLVAGGLDAPPDASLSSLIREAWERRKADPAPDPHTVVGGIPCPIFVNASPWSLLPEALRAAGKDPVVELCRWRADAYDWPPSIFETEPTYQPTIDRPLVFQVFGSVAAPDSLVLTEDDYFDFVIAVTENRATVPAPVRRALADSALLLLGFELQSWDVRVLLRTLLGQEGNRKLHKYAHVAAQVDLAVDLLAPQRARRYLERYFGKVNQPSIDIYWGTVDDFVADLSQLLGKGDVIDLRDRALRPGARAGW